MSDIKPSPSVSTASQPSSKPSTPHQHSTANQSSADRGGDVKGSSRRRWGEGRDESSIFQGNADDYSDSGSINRKGKRPEVQHYKPPGASKKPDETHVTAQDFDVDPHEASKVGSGTNSMRRPYRGRGRRGGHNYHQQQQNFNTYNAQNDNIDDTTRNMKNISIEDEYHRYNENNEGSYYKGNTGGRRKKKPEQLRYIPKKAGTGNDATGGSLERNPGTDIQVGSKKEEEKLEVNRQTPKLKDQNAILCKKDSVVISKEENVIKDEKYGTGKRNRNKPNKKEHKKDIKDNKDSFEPVHQEKYTEKRESGGKSNFQSNKEFKHQPKENGYMDVGRDDAVESTGTGNTDKHTSKKYSGDPTCNIPGNDPNLPPRLRGGDKQERPHTAEMNERGGRMGGRTGRGGVGKGGRWSGKYSRGNSPQGEGTSSKYDCGSGGSRASNSKKDDIIAKDENSHKYQGNRQNYDSKGINPKNINQNAFVGGPRVAKIEREKDSRQQRQGMKSSLSVGSDLSRSSDSFHQQHAESHGTQTQINRNKRNSLGNRGGPNFKSQSPSPGGSNPQQSVGGHIQRNFSPNCHSHNQNTNLQEGNERAVHRNEARFHRNRNSGIGNTIDNQQSGHRRADNHNRSSKDMSDWRYYREGSHQSISSDVDNQYHQDSRGGYQRGGYDEDRSWDKGNFNNIVNQINQSHREPDARERVGGTSQGRQSLGRSNSGVFGSNTGNVKHSGSVSRTSIPPRFQKQKNSEYLSLEKGDNHHHQENEEHAIKHKERSYQVTRNSESDWGSWRGRVPSHTEVLSNDANESSEIEKSVNAATKIQSDDDTFNAQEFQRLPVSSSVDQKPIASLSKQNNESDTKERIDSFTSDDLSLSKVTDWSLEVEEEEQQQREQLLHQQKTLVEPDRHSEQESNNSQYPVVQTEGNTSQGMNQGHHTGGIIRLPSQPASSSSASSNWRRDQIQHQSQDGLESQNGHSRHTVTADNQSHMLLDSSNPAWRGISNPEILHLQQQQQIAAAIAARAAANAGNRTGNQQSFSGPQAQRYLFDHKNPTKPIHVGPNSNNSTQSNPRAMPNNGDLGIIPGARFALDPRFVHPARAAVRHHNPSHENSSHQSLAQQQHPYTQAYHPMTGQPLSVQHQSHFPSAYRPPFPNVYGGSGPRVTVSGSPITGPPPGVVQVAQLNSKQGTSESSRNEWQHSISSSHPQMMQVETKPDFETIKYNEMALFETSKLIVTNDLLSQGSQKLRRVWDNEVAQARRNILLAFQRLLQNDLVFCAEKDVEFLIWRICFYNLVETLKSMLKHSEQSLTNLGSGSVPPIGPCLTSEIRSMIEQIIRSLLDEGLEFYSYMLDTLDKTYNIGLDKYYDVLEPRSPDANMRCVLVSAQKCLLCLGDLARYKEQTQETSNYGKARQYYQKASHVDTRNGRPYNQLAILAYTTKRKFEAVYYNMRCLSCKSSVRSSQESLTVIFEDIAKKWELTEKRRLEDKEERKKEAEREKESAQLIKGTRLRKEIWIRPEGGGRRLHRTTSAHEVTPDSDEVELQDMSTTDLNRRFNNTFLYIVGKLYTNINMDTFSIAAELLQKEFRVLLSRSPLPIDTKRLVQIMALNMFVIEQTKMKTGDVERYRSVAQNSALQLSFGMFGVLLERCNILMESFRLPDFSNPNNMPQTVFLEEDLPTLLAAVKVWCDWLLGNNDTWFPIVCHEPFNELAKLATHLEKLKTAMRDIIKHFINSESYYNPLCEHYDQENYEMIKLSEDALLCGFNPWFCGLDWSTYRRYCHKTVPPTLAQDVRRLDTINDCIDYLEGFDPPILKWSKPDNAHISLVENTRNVTNVEKVNAKLTHMLSREQDILEEAYSDEEGGTIKLAKESNVPQVGAIVVEEEGEGINKIKKLKIRKEELERRKREEDEQSKLQKQILEEHVSVTIEVCPRQVVPDTNCFVDSLSDIRKIALDTRFQLRVPLVVLNELDGLAKGIKMGQSIKCDDPDHVRMIAEKAQLALAFLRDRPTNTKCVTSKGTILPSFGVTTEEDARQGKTNDDLILDTCIYLASTSAIPEMNNPINQKEIGVTKNMRYVIRDIVLLTGDRNLRLKAHATDIPVNKLTDFIKWAFSK